MTKVLIAIFGMSCTGKTEISRRLAKKLGAECRHCGEEVKSRAAALRCSVRQLSRSEHVRIDNESRELAKRSTEGREIVIIEGCFLDTVLAKIEDVQFFHLLCEDSERARRFEIRGETRDADDLSDRDGIDSELQEHLFSGSAGVEPTRSFKIDTTQLSLDEMVDIILGRIKRRGY